ncbi:MAG: formate--tetrahydrofolate ligase [Planctomycetes bacterium]|nr:formate--tetrahydrofolate ligase [Planctomycetota bacterium]
MKPDIEIAREARPRPIEEVAADLGLGRADIMPFGPSKAKVALPAVAAARARPRGKLILVSGITPTPSGEGKTTTSVGLAQAMGKLGRRGVVSLREPSLGPCFGLKGGATGGGRSQVIPMEDINLHFTGDFHAVEAAHNLAAAVLDNQLSRRNERGVDPRRVVWRRVMDMNDRSLRKIVCGLGGTADGMPRESGFEITVASEVMAALCLARDLPELRARLDRAILAYTRGGKPVTAGDLRVAGAMTALLYEAIAPNLVQTLEGTPAFVHGGPFANLSQGTSSLISIDLALHLGEYAIVEAGFGFDLGGEKFFDIVCRAGGWAPDAVVLVATVRALKYHGGVALDELPRQNLEALSAGFANLEKQAENIEAFGTPFVIAINRFPHDTLKEVEALRSLCDAKSYPCAVSEVWEHGGEGGRELAESVFAIADHEELAPVFLYDADLPIVRKIEAIARRMYGARSVEFTREARRDAERAEALGYGGLPVCIAKTQSSLSDDPSMRGRPRDFELVVREIRIAAAAGTIVAVSGTIMTMPGLPETPAAEVIDIDEEGRIVGLS